MSEVKIEVFNKLILELNNRREYFIDCFGNQNSVTDSQYREENLRRIDTILMWLMDKLRTEKYQLSVLKEEAERESKIIPGSNIPQIVEKNPVKLFD